MSIVNRSAISFLGNISKAACTFLTGILLARGFGAETYGIYAFLLASFMAINTLLELGTSSAFYTFISKKNRSKNFFIYYLFWLFAQFIIIVIAIGIVIPDIWIEQIWKGQEKNIVLTAFIAIFLQYQIWTLIAQVGESQRLTSRVQILNVLIAICHLIVILFLYLLEELSLFTIYYLIMFEFIIAFFISFKLIPIIFSKEDEKPREIFLEYWVYCMPLIPFAGVNMIMRFSDTWLLQHFGGSVEQAYYAVSSQFANISLIATASVLRILWKEVADANEKKNPEIVRELYHRASKILYFFSVIISGFLIPWVPTIIKLTLGDEYIAGTSVMMLMFLYPIHQSLGQVVGTMFYALELTRIYVIIGISFMLISTISVYFFLASSDSYIPGLGLGSLGLALKMVILQFLGVNFSIWYLARIKGWTYNPLYQIFIMMIFFSIGFLSYFLVSKISFLSSSLILGFLLSGFLYLVFSIIILYIKPDLIDVSRVEIKERIYVIFNFLRNRKA